ncbi:zinc finger protein-like 1 homolog [Neltuma alba]|uniref:zinc finger protein-like 1 homolog n=1 Tax=Neltuma alba TaxID=207710 RepID=UPI0010A4763F|nr:zinc finger protein-like 1 homolog [Prosopis alba]
MVVCKCRKATKLYCFVHKVPVCGECVCFPEHQICVVRTYSEWVIDGDYDWPPKCCQCQAVLDEGAGSQTTRLGCLHVIHTNCLVSHVKSFPPHTAPAGYVCPACSTSIWPPKSVKDSGSRLHSKLKEAIGQTGMEKNLFGNHPVSLPVTKSSSLPPAFDSEPLISREDITNSNSVEGYSRANGSGPSTVSVTDIVEIEGPTPAGNFMKASSPTAPGATTRKGSLHIDRQNSEVPYYADDEDGNSKKYTRRGSLRHKFLRALLPFWSGALPTLPVTAPPRKDTPNANDVSESRTRHQKSSRMDPRKILLVIAIMACLATMGILYYRLAQRGPGEELPSDEQR